MVEKRVVLLHSSNRSNNKLGSLKRIVLDNGDRVGIKTKDYYNISRGDSVYVVYIKDIFGKKKPISPVYSTKDYVYGDDIKTKKTRKK